MGYSTRCLALRCAAQRCFLLGRAGLHCIVWDAAALLSLRCISRTKRHAMRCTTVPYHAIQCNSVKCNRQDSTLLNTHLRDTPNGTARCNPSTAQYHEKESESCNYHTGNHDAPQREHEKPGLMESFCAVLWTQPSRMPCRRSLMLSADPCFMAWTGFVGVLDEASRVC